jgi:hypothetical protein
LANRCLLLYCIANKFNNELSEVLGLDKKNKLYAVEHKNIYGIVSELDSDEYDEESIGSKSEDIDWLTENAKKFMDIILTIHKKSNIIPMKFMTIFNSEERVKNVMEEKYNVFLDNFEKIEGKEELSLKIYCNDKIFKENCMGEEIEKFEKSLTGKPKGAAFFLRKKFDGELNDRVQNKICKEANLIAENVQEFSEDMKSNKLLAKEITGIDIPMILNCAILVDINKKEEFETYIRKVKEEYGKSGFLIELSGPWPPFDFCQ